VPDPGEQPLIETRCRCGHDRTRHALDHADCLGIGCSCTGYEPLIQSPDDMPPALTDRFDAMRHDWDYDHDEPEHAVWRCRKCGKIARVKWPERPDA
jgi:hypothetical protein